MFIKACIFSLSVMGMIFLYFPQTATSLQCYNCVGAKKEPYQDANCNKIHNCTGAENNCIISIFRNKISEPASTFTLGCRAAVDCKRLVDGCSETQSNGNVCTKCCTSDLCNLPTTFRVTDTTAPPTTSSASWIQVSPFTFFLVTLTVFWFGDY